jgi:O-acetyl-ADP-ribose deacetylase (regulator of RNase III)
MIHYVTGDILFSKAQLIAHGVAPNDHFEIGLARSLRERWPAMFKDFRHYCHVHHPKTGGLWTWGGPGGVRITSLFTQGEAYGHGGRAGKATVEAVGHSLKALRGLVAEEKITSLALPKVATGVGGLKWDDVEPLMKRYLSELDIPVIVYTEYHADMEADESALLSN